MNIYEALLEEAEINKNEENFLSVFVTLSPNLKEIMLTDSDVLWNIETVFNLSETQSQQITLIVGHVILGDIFWGDIILKIAGTLGLDNSVAKDLWGKITSTFLEPGIEEIKKVQKNKFADRIKEINKEPLPSRSSVAVNQNNIIDLRNQ